MVVKVIPGMSAAAAALLWTLPAAAQDVPLLAPLFQDHGVLQRDKPLPVWGNAAPGQPVEVEVAGKSARATADAAGRWRVELPALAAGGPYTLTVRAGSRTQTANDVLIGDVWLCSGQSNMELSVSQALNAHSEIANANDPMMRLITVQKDSATAPLDRFKHPLAWEPVTPKTIGEFSAACYFMARDLKARQKVPFGLIDSTWGGTAINAWRSAGSLAADPVAKGDAELRALYQRDPAAAARQWGTGWMDWWRERSSDAEGREPWQANAPGQWLKLPAFELWEGWGVPAMESYNGIVWYRTEIRLTAAQAKKATGIELGIADDMDVAFVNGVPVGSTNVWNEQRSYRLAPGVLKAGVNRITIGVIDTGGGGGMYGKDAPRLIKFADGTTLALPPASKWQYRATPGIGDSPHTPWESTSGQSGLYNAMIAPIGPYRLRGVAWYQGEADTGAASGYATRLAGLISGWRSQFGDPQLPFLIVQIAGWGPRNAVPVESGNASIRDEQRRAVAADRNAALTVATDLGDVWDIHPANKQEVGRRLALGARARAYGEQIGYSGPWPVDARRSGNSIRITFTGADGPLQAWSASRPIGFELCGAAYASCRFVEANIDGATVVIDTAGGGADRVRYCWGDSPVCTLSDRAGLPATPFELKVE
ncbi:9-O-acetylesterase [Nostoc sp. 3335mG]|nr:9-O-acetylesterase [Nostoc sp. 3335mG]